MWTQGLRRLYCKKILSNKKLLHHFLVPFKSTQWRPDLETEQNKCWTSYLFKRLVTKNNIRPSWRWNLLASCYPRSQQTLHGSLPRMVQDIQHDNHSAILKMSAQMMKFIHALFLATTTCSNHSRGQRPNFQASYFLPHKMTTRNARRYSRTRETNHYARVWFPPPWGTSVSSGVLVTSLT